MLAPQAQLRARAWAAARSRPTPAPLTAPRRPGQRARRLAQAERAGGRYSSYARPNLQCGPREGGAVSTAVWAFIGVVAGGLLTVAAQATAESLKARAAARARQEQRHRASREFQRETLIELQAAMADYRAALDRDKSQLLPLRSTEQQVAAARAREVAALPWFQGDDSGTAAAEADAWETAMRVTGEAVRATD